VNRKIFPRRASILAVVLILTMTANACQSDARAQQGANTNQPTPTTQFPPADPAAVDIVRDPTDLPAPIGNRGPQTVSFDLETEELSGKLASGTTFRYWTFNGKVPGPFLRVRVGDTVEIHLKNASNSTMSHSIDLHAVTGPGGGSAVTQVPPGGEKTFAFKALHPGLFVYHCATPMVALHIANGMFGMILVEPAGGLPAVDLEYYVMQSEIYTLGSYGQGGNQIFDAQKILAETPDYFVFNGAVGSLTDDHPLKAKTGETIRIFFGDAGPNLISSFHIIGEVMDKVYNLGSLSSAPLTDVQTTLVPPGGAAIIELGLEVPGKYLLVDHAISRVERGLVGNLIVEGPDNPDIYRSLPDSSGQ
jgi:nitrite reductase (NO-forming)